MAQIIERTLYDLNDITIVPAVTSEIDHRSVCNVYTEEDTLPIFVSPMDTVVNCDNYKIFEKNKVVPIIPRTDPFDTRLRLLADGVWIAFSMDEFDDLFCNKDSAVYKWLDNQEIENREFVVRVLIDIADGHIKNIIDLIKYSKQLFSKYNCAKLVLMVGNIAHPMAYKVLADAGADYVRCGIGGGTLCLTTANCAVHYPMASLLSDCEKLKKSYGLTTKIISDGGISSYSRAITAIACGADYVMIGSVFGKCFESAGSVTNAQFTRREMINGLTLDEINKHRKKDDLNEDEKKYYITMNLQKVMYGMSTRRAQKKMYQALRGHTDKDECKTKTSEGLEKIVNIEYTLFQWLDNFISFLRSTMSYSEAYNLQEFRDKAILMLLSPAAQAAFNK